MKVRLPSLSHPELRGLPARADLPPLTDLIIPHVTNELRLEVVQAPDLPSLYPVKKIGETISVRFPLRIKPASMPPGFLAEEALRIMNTKMRKLSADELAAAGWFTS